MNSRPGIILQARMASSRLPGKALEVVRGRTIVQHCLRRLLSSSVSRVVLATTTRSDDDALADIAARAGVGVFRGSEDDVLGRVAAAAEQFCLDPVIRATADNPAVDPGAVERLLAALARSGADYASETGLPVGAAVEAMTASALHYAAAVATSPYDREHVTPYIKGRPDVFRVISVPAPAGLTCPGLRLTVDTGEDLARIRRFFDAIGDPDASVADLIGLVDGRLQEVA